jgi:hypothetical protein
MRVKTILQELTEEVRVDSREAIEPTSFVPAVRPPSGSMERQGLEPAFSCLQDGVTLRNGVGGGLLAVCSGSAADFGAPCSGSAAEKPTNPHEPTRFGFGLP